METRKTYHEKSRLLNPTRSWTVEFLEIGKAWKENQAHKTYCPQIELYLRLYDQVSECG